MNEGIPNFLDAIVLIDYTDYATQKTKIQDYLSNGGVVIGIGATDGSNNDLNDIFGLTQIAATAGDVVFSSYDPSQEDVEKYFLGLGFSVIDNWYIFEERWNVNYIGQMVNITNSDQSQYRHVGRGDVFTIFGRSCCDYFFKIKEIVPGTRTEIQPLNVSFAFNNFAESENGVRGNINIIKKITSNQAAMTSNGSAIWISDFPWSHEYASLVKSAIVSRNDEWVAKQVYTNRETTTVSSFLSLCCDMPETIELELVLWYVV
jgi:hypothetical protein